MAHPWYHAIMAARSFGGTPDDYLALEQWMDYTKSHVADCRHRLFLHNSWGIYVAERVLGVTLRRASDGKIVPTRPLLEAHVIQDFGKIPTLARCLAQLPPEPLADDIPLFEHCQRSASTWGGAWQDYQPLHHFLEWPREHVADGRFRRILHNSWGVALAAEVFGEAFPRPSDSAMVPVRNIAEMHIHAEMGVIPTLAESLDGLHLERWMCVRAMPAHIAECTLNELQSQRILDHARSDAG
jgi:hypothetical protein